jgi:hypothetical protein
LCRFLQAERAAAGRKSEREEQTSCRQTLKFKIVV